MNKSGLAIGLLALFALMSSGFRPETPAWGDEKAGFVLKHQLAEGQQLSYELSSKGTQQQQVMGQQQTINQDVSIAFSLAGDKSDQSGKLTGRITIGGMSVKTARSAGEGKEELARDLSGVIGKSFGFIISPAGRKIEMPGIEKLTFDMGPNDGGVRDIQEFFLRILPDFSEVPVKIGEPWTNKEEITVPMGSYSLKTIAETVSKIDGYEKVDGIECLKVSSITKGTAEGGGTIMNAPLLLDGDMKSQVTWLFAYKKGFLAKASSDLGYNLVAKVGGEQGIEVPVIVKSLTEIRLVNAASPK